MLSSIVTFASTVSSFPAGFDGAFVSSSVSVSDGVVGVVGVVGVEVSFAFTLVSSTESDEPSPV